MLADRKPTGSAHIIDPEHFRALASGRGDHQVVAELCGSERSWRLAALLSIVNACAGRTDVTGPLASIDDAWSLLVEAFHSHADITEDVLARPQVGTWAARALRRLEDVDDKAKDLGPIWADVGYLHSLIAAIAVRTGISFELDVPVRDNTVVLPTVGSATLPPGTTYARVRAADGQAAVLAGDLSVPVGGDGWHPPITVAVDLYGVPLEVEILDRDIYRRPDKLSQPRPIDAAEATRWRQLLTDAWEILAREQPDRARSISRSLRMLAPMPAEEPYRQLSASGGQAFGGVLLSMPDDAVQLAATLVHETQHHKLHALTHLLPLTSVAPGVRYYASIAPDERCPRGALLRTVAR